MSAVTADGVVSLGTVVTVTGDNSVITGGATRGGNLFHSFSAFNIANPQTAIFDNAAAAAITNVIGRISGGASSIDGSISFTGASLSSANLYLINPGGIVFGSNASINIPGSFHASTADRLMLGGTIFDFTTTAATITGSSLYAATPTAFGFLDNSIAAITVDNGSNLSVNSGETLSLVGGNININGGDLTAAAGQINLVSLATLTDAATPVPGLVSDFASATPTLSGFATQGAISINSDSVVSVSGAAGEAGGNLYIRGGSLSLSGSSTSLVANNNSMTTDGGLIDINVTGAYTQNAADLDQNNTSDATSTGIIITADSITLSGGIPTIHADASGTGDAGDITLTADTMTLSVADIISDTTSTLSTGGDAGDITLNAATSATLTNQYIFVNTRGGGNAGNISLTGGDWTATAGTRILANATNNTTGDAGNIGINVNSLSITNSNSASVGILSTTGTNATGNAGNITITAATDIDIDNTRISSSTGAGSTGDAGNVNITGNTIDVINGSRVESNSAAGTGESGIAALRAMSGAIGTRSLIVNNSTISASTGDGGSGNAATDSYVWLQTNGTGQITNGAKIQATTNGDGDAGYIYIQGLSQGGGGNSANGGTWTIEGATTEVTSSQTSGTGAGDAGLILLGDSRTDPTGRKLDSLLIQDGATISTNTIGTAASNAGVIDIKVVNALTVNTGATISSSTNDGMGGVGLGDAGDITIYESGTFTLDGAGISTNTTDGVGGNISITSAVGMVVNDNASTGVTVISSGTDGDGTAGSVSLLGGDWTISGDADNAVPDGSELGMSTIVSSSQTNAAGLGGSGDVIIDVNSLVVEDYAQIKSDTISGAGGTVSLTVDDTVGTGQILTNADVTANSSGAGIAGDVLIDDGSWTISGSGTTVSSNQTASAGTGSAGSVTADVNTLIISNSARVESKSSSTTAAAGAITITANDGSNDAMVNDLQVISGASLNTTNTTGSGGSGDVTITTGTLLFDDGDIFNFTRDGAGGTISVTADYASITNNSQVRADTFGSAQAGDIDFNSGSNDGAWTINGGSDVGSGTFSFVFPPFINIVSTGTAGNVDIDLESLIIEGVGTTVTTSTSVNAPGDAGFVDINVAGDLQIRDRALVASNSDTGFGAAGVVTIVADTFTLDGAEISTKTSEGGTLGVNAGDISITATTTGTIQNNNASTAATKILATSDGAGDAGIISLSGGAWTISGDADPANMDTSEGLGSTILSSNQLSATGTGDAGGIRTSVNSLAIQNFAQLESNSVSTEVDGMGIGVSDAGRIQLDATTSVVIDSTSVITSSSDMGLGAAGTIAINADTITLNGTSLSTNTSAGPGGNIELDATTTGQIINNAVISSNTSGNGDAGSISIDGGAWTIAGDTTAVISSQTANGTGDAGLIDIDVTKLTLSGGARIESNTGSTSAASDAGSITITATDGVDDAMVDDLTLVSGVSVVITFIDIGFGIMIPVPTFTATNPTIISDSSGGNGNAGAITINTGTGSITNGFVIANTKNGTVEGDIDINADHFTLTGSSISADTVGTGNAGNISLDSGLVTGDWTISSSTVSSTAALAATGDAGLISSDLNNLTINSSSSLSTSGASTTSNAGNISLDAATSLIVNGMASITSTTGLNSSGNAGAISLSSDASVLIEGAAVISSNTGTGSSGSAGLIRLSTELDVGTDISTDSVIIQGAASISSNSSTGTGSAGNIQVDTDNFTLDGASIASETNAGAVQGTISINAKDTGTIKNDDASAAQTIVSANSTGTGIAGNISLTGNDWNISGDANNDMDGSDLAMSTIISSSTTGAGDAGKVTISADGMLTISDYAQVQTQSDGDSGSAGDISLISSNDILLNSNATITSSLVNNSTGNAGNIIITTEDGMEVGDTAGDTITIQGGATVTSSSVNGINTGASANAGTISINTDIFTLNGSANVNTTNKDGTGAGGVISINANETGLIETGGQVLSNTIGNGDAGLISITGGDWRVVGGAGAQIQSSQTTNLAPDVNMDMVPDNLGDAGDIVITVNSLTMNNSALIESSTVSDATGGMGETSDAGSITITADDGDSSTTDLTLDIGINKIYSNSDDGVGAAGDIVINAGSILLDTADVFAETRDGVGGTVTFNVTDFADITGVTFIRSDTYGTGTAGGIAFNGGDYEFTTFNDITSTAQTGSSGDAGSITSTANSILIDNGTEFSTSTKIGATGNAGLIDLDVNTLVIDNNSFVSSNTGNGTGGNAGAISISGNSLTVMNGAEVSTNTGIASTGNAGAVAITSANVNILAGGEVSSSSADGTGDAGSVTINSTTLTMNDGEITTETSDGAGGLIDIDSDTVTVSNFSDITADTDGAGDAGNIEILASDVTVQSGSVISSSSVMGTGSAGNVSIEAGDITINNASVQTVNNAGASQANVTLNATNANTGILTNGAVVTASTIGDGDAGSISLLGPNWIISGAATQVTSSTSGNGDAGQITATTGNFLLDAATVSTNSTSAGDSGAILIDSGLITLTNGGTVQSNVSGTGNGGVVTLTSGSDIFLSNGAEVSTNTTPNADPMLAEGNAGNIFVNAVGSLSMTSSLLTSSTTSDGEAGTITINTGDSVYLLDSTILVDSTGATSPGVGGGNLNVTTGILVLDGSILDASAGSGTGGNVSITADFFFISPDSVIDVSSGSGASGTVSVNAVAVDLSGSLNALKVKFKDGGKLLRQACSTKGAESNSSSFIVENGIEGIPSSPVDFQSASTLDVIVSPNVGGQGLETSSSGLGSVSPAGTALFAAIACGGF